MSEKQATYYIGLMSGTSMDGIDAALVSFKNEEPQLINTTSISIPTNVKSKLTTLLGAQNIHLKLLGETDVQMGHLFADAVLNLLQKNNTSPNEIIAIGSHGQTIYHSPDGAPAFTLQIGDPNIIAARTNITTVADFRRRDIALSGQGAPLVPAFHDYLFQDRKYDHYILNIGGIANITYLPADKSKSITGFDTGPGNTLLDLWNQQHQDTSLDFNGQWARSGKLNTDLLNNLLDDPYFKKSPPKTTGREYFNLKWLHEKLKNFSHNPTPVDIQTTLTELTAQSIATTISQNNQPNTLIVCGGGAKNHFLMERLRAQNPSTNIQSSEAININPQWIEAMAFAWLAKQTIEKKPGNLPSVTGALQKTILGGIYY